MVANHYFKTNYLHFNFKQTMVEIKFKGIVRIPGIKY